MNDIKEIPVAFGPDQSLVGVVAALTGSDSVPLACLMFNADGNPRVGPGRIHVKLARQLAERGVSSIRFDLAGQGDSAPARSAEQGMSGAVRDLRAAMDLIDTLLGIRRFIVIGLGSGAGGAMALAQTDARVLGLLMFDGPAFPGRRSRWERAARRLLALMAPPAWAGARLRAFDGRAPQVSAGLFRRTMAQLAERSVAVLAVYSGSCHAVDHGRDQLGPLAYEPFMCDVEYRFEAGIDHGLSSIAGQRIFMAAAGDWVMRVAHARTAPPAPQRAGTDFAELAIH